MINDWPMYRRVCAEVKRLDKLIKAGTATPLDLERHQAGIEEEVCWELEHEDSVAVELMPPLPPLRDRRARAFADWWDCNEYQIDLDVTTWPDAFTWWVTPLELSAAEELALMDEVAEEIYERRGRGMVIADPERIPDGDGEEVAA